MQFLGDMPFDVAHQLLDELVRLLLADPLVFGIALARVAEVGSIEGQVDVLGEAADGAERFGQGRPALENEGGSLLLFCNSKRRFRVQQTQKSFSMMVLWRLPRAAPVSPKESRPIVPR